MTFKNRQQFLKRGAAVISFLFFPPTYATIPPSPSTVDVPLMTPAIHHNGLEVSKGNLYAPLTIVMYYSLTCPHCHDFMEKTFPEIEKQFIEKGTVRFVFRDFPTDGLAIQAAKVAWCMGKDHYLRIAKKFLATQDQWAHPAADPKDPIKAIYEIAEQCSIPKADCKKCLDNMEFEETVLRTSFEAQKTYAINFAPAFIINGKLFSDDLTPASIQDMLTKMGIHGRD